MEPSRNKPGYFSSLLRFECNRSRDALSGDRAGQRDDRRRCSTRRLHVETVGRTESGGFQKRRWLRHPWSTVHSSRQKSARSSADLYARWSDAANAARLSLHVLLPQCVRHESVLGEPGLCRTVSELPAWDYVWTRFPRSC